MFLLFLIVILSILAKDLIGFTNSLLNTERHLLHSPGHRTFSHHPALDTESSSAQVAGSVKHYSLIWRLLNRRMVPLQILKQVQDDIAYGN